ncbi:M14 family metallopeptidase [Enterococcus sp. AZ196]|uniref:M14 family metallopeptidase n=1 Tax=Enterococcus sp. AZ196 TaxID=2774659 RepID=UPI003D2B76A1
MNKIKSILHEQNSGTTNNFFWQITGTELTIPITIIKGRFSGSTLLITAGIHGSEYPGIEAARRLLKEIQPEDFAGAIIILPCVNQRAFFARTAFINPMDGKNINRCFPGKARGSETEKITYALEKEIFPLADFYLDFHSGDLPESLEQFVFIPSFGANSVVQTAYRGANHLKLPFGVVSHSRIGSCTYACSIGLPALLIERGGFGECLPEAIDGFIDDAYQIMAFLEMIEKRTSDKEELPLIRSVHYSYSPVSGLWHPALSVGMVVKKDQFLGSIEDFFGTVLYECFAEQEGKILYQVGSLAINQGEHLIAYGH